METPYSRDKWSIEVKKIKNTFYFEIMHLRNDTNDDIFSYYGYKFEDSCTEPVNESRKNDVVNPNVQYCSIVEVRLASLKVILAAEMDCYQDPKPKLENYVELKTYKEIDSDKSLFTWQRYVMNL